MTPPFKDSPRKPWGQRPPPHRRPPNMPPVRPHSRRRRFIEQESHSLTPRLRPSLVHIRVWRKRKRVHLSTVRVRREGDQIRPCPHSLGVEEIGPNRIFAPPYGRERGGGREIRGVRKGREGVCNCDTGRRVNSFPSQKAKFPLQGVRSRYA